MGGLMTKRLRILLVILIILLTYLVWQFWPVGTIPRLPEGYHPKIAVWIGVTWSMDAHTDEELQVLAENLKQEGVDDAFVYLSYLRADHSFNPSYDYAAGFLKKMREFAPQIHWFAWIGVPISIETSDGIYQENRLEDETIRQKLPILQLLV